ncbi:zinc finger protein GLIS2 [Brachyhypopomus gauderio]|uniref:zinc finger protein GLIS2 n=1 Tax=Brachyhypopomus gauderio TaxID=698409 RepID=UPI0040427BB4
MLSLDEPLDLKISSSDRALRTSICAPLRFARTQILCLTHDSDTGKDILDYPPSSKLDLCVSPSSSSPSPQHSPSSCSPLAPPLAMNSDTIGYLEDGASSPPSFQFFLPINSRGSLRHSMLIGQRQERRESPEPGDEQHACRWLKCHLLFECLQDLVDHVTEFHVKPERRSGYCCHWEGCARKGRGFNARYKMLIHIRTHTNEKPHQCPICSKSFSRLENLKIHTRSHTGEKPYACPYAGCGKRYSNSSDRFKHTRTHYEDRPYCCKMAGCPKRYTDPSSLRKHIKAHGHAVAQEAPPSPGAEPLHPWGHPGGGVRLGEGAGAEPDLSNPPDPGRARLVLPGETLALLRAHALHAFSGPLMALAAPPLDLFMASTLPGVGAVLSHRSGTLGLGKTHFLEPFLLPSLTLGAQQRGKGGDDDDEEEEEDDDEERAASQATLSWVFVPPGMMMLNPAVVS